MKKSLIATAGVAAFAVAAVPAAVFAATSTEFTDNLSVQVQNGCTMENGTGTDGVYVDRSFGDIIATGNFKVLTGTSNANLITVKCNTNSGTVTIKATPANSGNLKGTTDDTKTIAPGAVVADDVSGWAIKSNASGATSDPWAGASEGTAADAGYYVAAPTAEQTFLTATASTSGTTTFNPSYRVYIANNQVADTYTGSVTYKLSYSSGSGS